jgi:hypothetical protein
MVTYLLNIKAKQKMKKAILFAMMVVISLTAICQSITVDSKNGVTIDQGTKLDTIIKKAEVVKHDTIYYVIGKADTIKVGIAIYKGKRIEVISGSAVVKADYSNTWQGPKNQSETLFDDKWNKVKDKVFSVQVLK